VRRHCLDCCNGNPNEVRQCIATSCALWPFRLGHRPTEELKAAVADQVLHPPERQITGKAFHDAGGTALRAIRLRCLDCSGASAPEVAACRFSSCDLHAFRFGKNPNIKLTEERKAAIAELGRQAFAKTRSVPSEQRRNSESEANAQWPVLSTGKLFSAEIAVSVQASETASNGILRTRRLDEDEKGTRTVGTLKGCAGLGSESSTPPLHGLD
jgi:hypothetical protein